MWLFKCRDVTGVPVVRALEGPMRVTPEEPGGDQANYQGLAVNTVAAAGIAAGPADRLVLAPPPLDLSAEDRAATELAAMAEVDYIPYWGAVSVGGFNPQCILSEHST